MDTTTRPAPERHTGPETWTPGKPAQTSVAPAKPAVVAPRPAAPKSPFVGKTVQSLKTYTKASVFGVELLFTDGTSYYVKTKQGVEEYGGTAEWGTGQPTMAPLETLKPAPVAAAPHFDWNAPKH